MLPFFTLRQTAGAFCAVCLALAPAAVHAQAFTFTLLPPVQSISLNATATFSGTITNTTSTALYINGDALDPLAVGLTTDDTPFVNTFGGTPVLLGAGQTYSLTNFFTVTNTGAAAGTYQGEYTIYGGTTPAAEDMSGFQQFNVLVPSAAVPEASSLVSLSVLLAGGLVVVTAKRRKRAA